MIPAELVALPQWVAWQYEIVNGRRTKVPYQAIGRKASSTDPATWTTLDRAKALGMDGIGFVVSAQDAYLGIDLDHCIADKQLDPQARAIVGRFGSYAEVTPSKEGIRVWIKAALPAGKGRNRFLENGVKIELYDRGRYFTVTGRKLTNVPDTVLACQEELDALFAELFPPPPVHAGRPLQSGPMRGGALSLSDIELLTKARAARNGGQFDRLWMGDTSGYNHDDSRADMALLCHLAFWTGKDEFQMDRLFRQSGLYRDKWERLDYRISTIAGAIANTRDIWTPGDTRVVTDVSAVEEEAPPPNDDGLVFVADVADELERLYDNGAPAGEHPGWESLAKFYRPQRSRWTLLTGKSSHGKSSWLDALLMNLINFQGWKFLICSPEHQPIEEHISTLLEKKVGKSFDIRPGMDRMSREEMREASKWLHENVAFAQPDSATIDAILDRAKRHIEKRGLDGLVIDPWNAIDHARPKNMAEHEYVSYCLGKIANFARRYAIHIWMVAHPTKIHRERKLNKAGRQMVGDDGKPLMYEPVPTPENVSGGYAWYSKADNCLCVWRDLSGLRNITQIHVQKIKFRNGKLGVVELMFLPQSGRFEDTGSYWEVGYDRPVVPPLPAPERPSYYEPEPPEREPEADSRPTLFDDSAGLFSDRRSQARTTGSADTLFDPDSGAIAPWDPDDVQVYGGR